MPAPVPARCRGRWRGRAWLALIAAAWCGLAPAAAQEDGGAGPATGTEPEPVWEVQFEPARFVAGEPVLARIVVRGGAELSAPAAVAGSEWLPVHAVEVLPRTDGSWEVRVRFTSYRPGVGELPAIDVGPLQLTGIGFLTASVLPRYGEVAPALRPPAAQMAVPGSAALLIGGALAVLVVPYLLVSGALLLAGAGGRARARRSRTRPRVQLERAVQRLQHGAPGGAAPNGAGAPAAPADVVAFYARLSQLARGYLAERLALPAHALTVGELRAALPDQGLPRGLGADLTAILDTADRVKFAGLGAGATEMHAAAAQLVTLARAIDAVLEERASRERGGDGVEF
ncbi:MAG: hypothetical protein OXC12_14960 [Spirochaetaceae bacterium]|nr:hypothetical protein [Spirochaetaceae bacterium]